MPPTYIRIIAFTVFGTVALVLAYFAPRFIWPNQTVLINDSEHPATDVVFVVADVSGPWKRELSADALSAGDSLVIRHSKNDSKVYVSFWMNGVNVEHRDHYVDLWTGEQWVVSIEDNGAVNSGYANENDD